MFAASHIHTIYCFVFREIKPATLVLHAVKRPTPKSIALSADEPDDASELKQEKTRSVVRKLNTDPLGKK